MIRGLNKGMCVYVTFTASQIYIYQFDAFLQATDLLGCLIWIFYLGAHHSSRNILFLRSMWNLECSCPEWRISERSNYTFVLIHYNEKMCWDTNRENCISPTWMTLPMICLLPSQWQSKIECIIGWLVMGSHGKSSPRGEKYHSSNEPWLEWIPYQNTYESHVCMFLHSDHILKINIIS